MKQYQVLVYLIGGGGVRSTILIALNNFDLKLQNPRSKPRVLSHHAFRISRRNGNSPPAVGRTSWSRSLQWQAPVGARVCSAVRSLIPHTC